jgi:methionyl-tRNA formyltransferase
MGLMFQQPPSPFTNNGKAYLSLPETHLLVTASFGRILSPSLLRLFPPGQRLNVHPSLLPAYRGPAPIQRALMQGEGKTGVCIIDMMEKKDGIDAGSVWGCESMASDKAGQRATHNSMNCRSFQKMRLLLRCRWSWPMQEDIYLSMFFGICY